MTSNDHISLPVYSHLDGIAEDLARRGILIVQAETGAGKTTLVPWRLLSHEKFTDSKIIMLQPRRIAARAAADRIATLLGEKPGKTVGLRTRTESITGPAVRLEVVTEGILTRMLQSDQSLEGYGTVIFDEFHERSLQADTALSLTLDCRATLRPDLRLLFMSATPPGEGIAAILDAGEPLSVPGRAFPVRVVHLPPLPGEKPWEGAARLVAESRTELSLEGGDVLVFLPGFREIERTREIMIRDKGFNEADIFILHGQLPPAEQRRVLANPRSGQGMIILSTNVAETSLTIPGVLAVVDTGLERRVSYSPRTGMDHRSTVPVSLASAKQRTGRAGRTGPGLCLRWWPEGDTREEFTPPEITRSDLAPLVLETALWGSPPPDLTWLTPPPRAALERASSLLQDLALIDASGKITPAGRGAARLGLHPRLGRMVMTALEHGWTVTAAATAAMLEEGNSAGDVDPDFRDRLSAWASGRGNDMHEGTRRRITDEARRIMRAAGANPDALRESEVDPSLAGRLLLMAYPDRAARRASGGSPSRWVMASGRAAFLKGNLAGAEFLAAADLDGGDTDARIYLAAPVTMEDLTGGLAGEPVEEHIIEWDGWVPRCRTLLRLHKLVLHEKRGTLPGEDDLRRAIQERLSAKGLDILPWTDESRRLLARIGFVCRSGMAETWPDFSIDALAADIDAWLMPCGSCDGGAVFTGDSLLQALRNRLGWENLRRLEELAPEQWILPSGSHKTIDYESGEIPVIAARLQEFFGCRQTPTLCGQPLLLHLLSPAGRPMQVTRDLDGFWDRAYPEVKKELKGRYPRHYWPDDPRQAEPTSRAKPRK